jgi:hypothetical protein
LVNSIIQDREVLESAKNFLTSEKVPGHWRVAQFCEDAWRF